MLIFSQTEFQPHSQIKMGYHPLSAVLHYLFNIHAAILHLKLDESCSEEKCCWCWINAWSSVLLQSW